jgi:putative membrane protein
VPAQSESSCRHDGLCELHRSICVVLSYGMARQFTPRIESRDCGRKYMLNSTMEFLAHWAIMALSLWVAGFIFQGITFSNKKALFVSALLLGLANAIIRPIIILLTIPLTLVTFGFFLLVINALMILLVSSVVPGFKVSGFWTAFFASIFISVLSFFVGLFIFQSGATPIIIPSHQGVFI